MTLHAVATVVAVIAVAVRLPNWAQPRSRPMTVALMALALLAVIREPVVERWFDRTTQRGVHLPDLVGLVADLLIILGCWALCRYSIQAWGKVQLFPFIRYVALTAALLLLVTYAPSGTDGWWHVVHVHIVPIILIPAHLSVLITAAIALRAAATTDRWTIILIALGALFGLATGIQRAAAGAGTAATGWRATTGALAIICYAVASLVNNFQLRRTKSVRQQDNTNQ